MIQAPPWTTAVWDTIARVTLPWRGWMQAVTDGVNDSPQQLKTVALTGQHASIGPTAIPAPVLTTGRYQVRWYARVTTVDGAASSLTITAGWTDGGVSCTFAGAAMTGNTTSTTQSQSLLLNADAATTVTYATTYASTTPNQMHYSLTVTLEQLP